MTAHPSRVLGRTPEQEEADTIDTSVWTEGRRAAFPGGTVMSH